MADAVGVAMPTALGGGTTAPSFSASSRPAPWWPDRADRPWDRRSFGPDRGDCLDRDDSDDPFSRGNRSDPDGARSADQDPMPEADAPPWPGPPVGRGGGRVAGDGLVAAASPPAASPCRRL